MVMAGRPVHLSTLYSWASLNKQLTSTSCTYFSLVTDTNPSWMIQRKENDRRNNFIINLHESMGSGQDWTRNPWICSQTRICCQTCYRLRYAAQWENDHRNYFMIYLHKRMGLGQHRTRDPWVCSQTHICSQTHYRLWYLAWCCSVCKRVKNDHLYGVKAIYLPFLNCKPMTKYTHEIIQNGPHYMLEIGFTKQYTITR